MTHPSLLSLFPILTMTVVLLALLALIGSQAEAEDAVQETFLAIHQALAALRVRARRKATNPLDDAASIADAGPLPDAVAAARQETRRLQQALEQLSVEHRTVLSLFAVDGLTHEEIADVLGIPTGTVWSRLHGARKCIAALLAEPTRSRLMLASSDSSQVARPRVR